MSHVNSWLSESISHNIDTPEPVVTAVEPQGPTQPQRGVQPANQIDHLPLVRTDYQAKLWIVGAHGGAGEKSIASLHPEWVHAAHNWPVVETGADCVLTARSSMRGLLAAQRVITQWASGQVPGVRLRGLIVSADAPGKLPRPIREFIELLSGGVPHLWQVPWIEEWRLSEVPQSTQNKAIIHLIRDLEHVIASNNGYATPPKGRAK